MTLGPPPSAAGPSHNASSSSSNDAATQPLHTFTIPLGTGASPSPASSGSTNAIFTAHSQQQQHPYYGAAHVPTFSVNSQATQIQPAPQARNVPYPPQTSYYSQQPPAAGAAATPVGNYAYYGYPPNAWANAWNTSTYQYPSGGSFPYPYPAPQQNAPALNVASSQQQQLDVPSTLPKQKTPSPTPSPSPPPQYHKNWDAVIKSFLSAIGFSQTLQGFEADMVVLNEEWEKKKVPTALSELLQNLLKLEDRKSKEEESSLQERVLEERKLDHVHFTKGAEPRSQTSITKDISRFLALNRARNDASNRNEFLLSVAEKRRRLNKNGDSELSAPLPSCARTDAKTQNRDLQMKYDIAKNEDGPLRRTIKPEIPPNAEKDATVSKTVGVNGTGISAQRDPTPERYPGLDERVQNIEKHFSVRYVPSPPRSLLDRLKFLEDHILHLEKEYPAWTALHFNQPNRGWPPPPRTTPIIVPSHLTSATTRPTELATPVDAPKADMAENVQPKEKAKQGRRTKSSLHRAVMEKLEVQKAINDLAGEAAE